MNRPYTTEITKKLSRPVATPISFWGALESDAPTPHELDLPWRQGSAHLFDGFLIPTNLGAASTQACSQAGAWLQFSANAVSTAALRCMVPPVAAYLAYHRASLRQDAMALRCWLPVVALASGLLISVVGIAVNAVQMVGGAAIAGMCMGLSGYLLTQAALETWRPAAFVASL